MYPMHDWSILEIEEVVEVLDQASRRLAKRLEIDVDDLQQEARILVTNMQSNLYPCVLEQEYGLLQHRLEQDLTDLYKREVRHRDDHESYEERNEALIEGESYGSERGTVLIRHDVSTYTRELVESLVPAIWDEDFCYGLRTENAPDPDMPRTATNKATGNTLAAHIADIKSAWAKGPLSVEERSAVFLCLSQDWSQEEAAAEQRVSQQAISGRLYRGVGKLVATLNGDEALLDSFEEEPVAA